MDGQSTYMMWKELCMMGGAADKMDRRVVGRWMAGWIKWKLWRMVSLGMSNGSGKMIINCVKVDWRAGEFKCKEKLSKI